MIKYEKSKGLTDTHTHYCPGCTHGILHKLVAEVLEELGILGKTIGVASVGCSVFAYDYFETDFIQSPHGRACAVATGIKRVSPDRVVFTYQGDGDLAAIGTAEIIHAAARGENITTVFVNNAVFGMTSGQMSSTSIIGQVTTTSPFGRKPEIHGHPLKVSEMLATIDGAVFVERVSMHDIKNIINAKKAIKKAFKVQLAKKGFSIVEVLSSCPTNWGMNPTDSLKWIKEKMLPVYEVKNFKGNELEV